MAQRVLAVLGAVALVLVAIVVRGAIDDDGSDDGRGEQADGELVVVCASDLVAACAALDDVTIIEQDAAATAASIEADDGALAGVDGWVTTTAWVEVVDSRAPGRLGPPGLVAMSTTVIAVDPVRADAVTALCAGESLWTCLGDNAGDEWADLGSGGQASWGTLRTGMPSASSAVGLPVLATAASSFFGTTDFASNDFDGAGFRGWLDALTEPSGRGEQAPIGTLVTARGKYTAVGDVAAAVGTRDVSVLEEAGPQAALVVVVPFPGGDRLPGPGPLRESLLAAGWTDPEGQALPALLKPGVMAALYTLWTEVTR